MTKNMTQGSPIKVIFAFFFPTLAGNLFQQLYNMADTIIVGKALGVGALAAVGSTGSLVFLIIGFVQGMCSGFSIPASQYFGAQEMGKMRRSAANAFYLTILISVTLTIAVVLSTRWILTLMNTPSDIFEDAYSYIVVIFLGIGATMFYNLLAGISRAVGDSRTPLYFLMLASLLNIALDLFFILVMKTGVSGAALATVISQGVSAILCFLYMRKRFPDLRMSREDLRPDPAAMGKLMYMGLPMALQFSITAIGSITLQTAVNSFGSSVVAAVTAADKVRVLFCQPLETMGITMATYSGQNLGAGKVDRVSAGVGKSLIAMTIYSLIAWVVMALAGTSIALLFLDKAEGEIMGYVGQILWGNGMFLWALGSLLVLRNAIQGLGFTIPAMASGLFELVARCFVALVLVKFFGFWAICYANAVAWIAANILLVPVFRQVMKNLRLRYPAEEAPEPATVIQD